MPMPRLFLVFFVLISACGSSSSEQPSSKQAASPSFAASAARASERDCLADAIYHEAKNTGQTGLQAVGHVVMNRVKDPRFPSTVCGVVREGEAKGRCQFSYRCDGIAETYPDRPAHARALVLASTFLSQPPNDITKGALFFHAKWAKPNRFFKSRTRVGLFGGNIFYL